MKSDEARLRVVHHLQVALNLARRHATVLQRKDLVVEAVSAFLVLGVVRRLEAAVAVARAFNGSSPKSPLRFFGYSFMALVAQVPGQFRIQCFLHLQPSPVKPCSSKALPHPEGEGV
jgi:hypothetical protein